MRLAYLCLIGLLLLAQQTAMTHATWHAAGADNAPTAERQHADAGSHDENAPASLCVYHAALAQMLGVDQFAPSLLISTASGAELQLCAPVARVSTELIPAVSRGPPLLL